MIEEEERLTAQTGHQLYILYRAVTDKVPIPINTPRSHIADRYRPSSWVAAYEVVDVYGRVVIDGLVEECRGPVDFIKVKGVEVRIKFRSTVGAG